MSRTLLIAAGISGFLAVALGAFGAHGLEGTLAAAADGAKRMEWWQTGAHYHLIHSLAIALAGLLVPRTTGRAATTAGWAFIVGILLFSGSLYVMTLTGIRVLGAVTPFGGASFMVGWASIAWAASTVSE
ncbi:MAG: uncharacterized membrane protein YgdD (TMEM256/DUF423 family) [Hyphomicrobiaceae bacterium]|jgi:uncharacterized membrane protein YgdD (TMEM256/DUF423 family)